MKGSDMALLAALGIGGYYLISKGKDTQQILPGGGGSPISLDLSGLLGGLGGLGGGGGVAMPDLSGLSGMLQGIFDTANKQAGGILDSANKQASGLLGGLGGLGSGGGVAMPDFSGLPGMLQGLFDTANKQAGGIVDAAKAEAARIAAAATAAGGGVGVIPAAVDLLGGLGGGVHLGGKNADWQGIKERSAGDFLGVGFAYLARFVAPMAIKAVPGVAASLGGKAALVGTGIGVPLAIAWTGADVLTTVYELSTGKDVPIVGFGELFHPTQKEAVVTQGNRESYALTNAHQTVGRAKVQKHIGLRGR